MKIPNSLFPDDIPQSREYQVISTITIRNNRLAESFFKDHKTDKFINQFLNDSKGNPIYFDENDCEWLSPTFIRNKDELYGFTLLEKGNSTKLFLTLVKRKVDFKSFKAIGRFYAKDSNYYYFGPGGKTIKEDNLTLFFDDTYREEWYKLNPSKKNDRIVNLWNSKNAISEEKVYWNGRLAKDLHASLKRITPNYWIDDHAVFDYNLQGLKKIIGIDRKSVIYKNSIKEDAISGLVTDKFKPAYCYRNRSEPTEKYDFKRFAPLFEERRNTLSKDYWWYIMEDSLR